jgi:hypothetical protein
VKIISCSSCFQSFSFFFPGENNFPFFMFSFFFRSSFQVKIISHSSCFQKKIRSSFLVKIIACYSCFQYLLHVFMFLYKPHSHITEPRSSSFLLWRHSTFRHSYDHVKRWGKTVDLRRKRRIKGHKKEQSLNYDCFLKIRNMVVIKGPFPNRNGKK